MIALRRTPALVILAPLLAGCAGSQSALLPLGPEADRIALLSWILFIGGTVILIAVVAFAAIALYGRETWRSWFAREKMIIAGGIVFPVVTLTVLLVYGLFVLRAGYAAPADNPLRVTVTGHQWWWRVAYETPDGTRFESANEVRIPTGRGTGIDLVSADVIHSFWVPNLAGKVDMIPGRTNRLTLQADRAGISRGQCAEYCGGAHALMAFNVVAMEPDDFVTWLAAEAAPARTPETPTEEQGLALFLSHGCGACHAIRGTEADGTIGPDLTHVGSRTSLAAGILRNDVESMAAWIEDNQHLKPENRMPPFRVFDEAELTTLAEYLVGLE